MKRLEPAITAPRPLRDARLTAINFVADAVNRSLDLREIADNALDAILALMRSDAAAVYIWQDTDNALRLFAWRGISEAFARQVTNIRKGDDVTVDAVLNGDTKVVEDFALVPHMFRVDVVRAGFRSAVLVPIRAHGFVVGLLALGTYREREFSADDVELIEVVSNQIGIAMVHAQLQADVKASEEQYRALVENSDDAIYIATPDGRPRFANSAFQKIFGFEPSEMAAMDPYERIHPDDIGTVRRACEKVERGEAVHNLDYRFCRKDGTWIDLQCTASVFSRVGEEVRELQLIVRDVTHAKRRQHQLLRRNRQLAALTMVAEVANSSLNIQEIARNTLEVALESTGMDGGGIHLANPDQTKLYLYLQIGLPDEMVEKLRVLDWGEGVAGTVAETGQVKVCADLPTEVPFLQSTATKHGFKPLIVVPIKAKGKLLGTLGLASRNELQFTPEVVEMVSAMGNHLGIALENARLFESQVRENEKLNALVDISSGSAQQLDLGSLLRKILEKSTALLSSDAGYIVRYDPRTEEAEVVAASAPFGHVVGNKIPAGEGGLGLIRASLQGRIFTRKYFSEHSFDLLPEDPELRSALVMPLVSRNNLIGALCLTRRGAESTDFGLSELELMQAFASRAAVAIDNAHLVNDLERKNHLLQLLVEEAHHRIKNNLQMISGLLQLEADAAGVGVAAEYLHTAIARIQAIAQVHNLLSEEMPEKVDVHTLISTIVRALAGSEPVSKNSPLVSMDLEHLLLSADQAVPLALIVNELVANSLLHGRPPSGETLQTEIRCARHGDKVKLEVCDNGGGFRSGQDWRQQGGQGMNIVVQLAQVNLHGDLQYSTRENGVCASLQFEIARDIATPSQVTKSPSPDART